MFGVLTAVAGPWWDAVLTDFDQFYKRDLRESWQLMPVEDLAVRVKRLVRIPSSALATLLSDGESEWGAHEENTAQLLEVQSYQLELDWAEKTTDPDDPEVKAERERAKASGAKPPKKPIVPPVALRPKRLAEQRYEEYVQQLIDTQAPQRIREQVDSDEFDRRMGLI